MSRVRTHQKIAYLEFSGSLRNKSGKLHNKLVDVRKLVLKTDGKIGLTQNI
jgi:hypothetical protein